MLLHLRTLDLAPHADAVLRRLRCAWKPPLPRHRGLVL